MDYQLIEYNLNNREVVPKVPTTLLKHKVHLQARPTLLERMNLPLDHVNSLLSLDHLGPQKWQQKVQVDLEDSR
jgi:hypothetical protein